MTDDNFNTGAPLGCIMTWSPLRDSEIAPAHGGRSSHPERDNFWAEGGSRRYLNTKEELKNTIKYVNEAQERKGIDQQY